LFRETPYFIQSINSELDPNESYVIDIPELANVITLDMNNGENLTTEQQKNRIYDYIFMCFFLGNDFMPHFPAINIRTGGVDKMINAYKSTIGKTDKNLTNGKKIFWENVRTLVQILADSEQLFIQNETKLRDRREKSVMPDNTPEDKFKKFESLPGQDRAIEKYINPFKPNWRLRYYKSLFRNDINEEHIKDICINYLQGLEWTMKYYTTGCANWRWSYQYYYPPLLCDLIKYVPCFDKEFIQQAPPQPVNELVQLCYVLPLQSLSLLPDNLYNKLLTSEYINWYVGKDKFIWAYCRYFWEAHVVLPHIDIDELEKLVHIYNSENTVYNNNNNNNINKS